MAVQGGGGVCKLKTAISGIASFAWSKRSRAKMGDYAGASATTTVAVLDRGGLFSCQPKS